MWDANWTSVICSIAKIAAATQRGSRRLEAAGFTAQAPTRSLSSSAAKKPCLPSPRLGNVKLLYRAKGLLRLGVARTKEILGAESQYCIRGAYKHRAEYCYFDDTELTDEWQREVYQRTAKLMKDERLSSICDVGCGSGYKFVNYLGEYDTLGLDVPETVGFLKEKYPARKWDVSDLDDTSGAAKVDVVISADVVEHVLNPDQLLRFIASKARKWVILSTPDRDLVYDKYSPCRLGPPRNPSHMREWSFNEFRNFVSRYFGVVEHVISNRGQATQMIVGRPH